MTHTDTHAPPRGRNLRSHHPGGCWEVWCGCLMVALLSKAAGRNLTRQHRRSENWSLLWAEELPCVELHVFIVYSSDIHRSVIDHDKLRFLHFCPSFCFLTACRHRPLVIGRGHYSCPHKEGPITAQEEEGLRYKTSKHPNNTASLGPNKESRTFVKCRPLADVSSSQQSQLNLGGKKVSQPFFCYTLLQEQPCNMSSVWRRCRH